MSYAQLGKPLLRVVFWSLGLAAVFGATGVLLSKYDTLWRIVGTCILTAFAALLALCVVRRLDREKTAMAGTMALALIIIEYLAGLGLTWDIFGRYGGHAAVSMFFLPLTAIPAIIFVHWWKLPVMIVPSRVGLFGSAATFVLLMIGVWNRQRWYNDFWFELAGWLALFASLAMLSSIGAGMGDRRHWRWVGVAASTLALGIAWYATIARLYESSWEFIGLLSLAVVVGHVNAILLCPLKDNQRWVLWSTVVASIATGVCVTVAAWGDEYSWDVEVPLRFAGAGAIVASCGTVGLLVLAWLNRRGMSARSVTIDAIKSIAIVCPVCNKKQSLPITGGQCASCNVTIQVKLKEPTCLACGYSLLMLKSDRCPECGNPVRTTLPAASAQSSPA